MPDNKFQRKLLTLISFPISSSLYSLAMKTVKKEVYDEILRRLVQQSDQEAANHFRDRASGYAVRLESDQTPFSRTGSQSRSAALHRNRFWTCCFVPRSYLYSLPATVRETNEWLKDWAKHWARLWSATSSCNLQWIVTPWKISFHMDREKIPFPLPKIYKALKPCWLSNEVSVAKVVGW